MTVEVLRNDDGFNHPERLSWFVGRTGAYVAFRIGDRVLYIGVGDAS